MMRKSLPNRAELCVRSLLLLSESLALQACTWLTLRVVTLASVGFLGVFCASALHPPP